MQKKIKINIKKLGIIKKDIVSLHQI